MSTVAERWAEFRAGLVLPRVVDFDLPLALGPRGNYEAPVPKAKVGEQVERSRAFRQHAKVRRATKWGPK